MASLFAESRVCRSKLEGDVLEEERERWELVWKYESFVLGGGILEKDQSM